MWSCFNNDTLVEWVDNFTHVIFVCNNIIIMFNKKINKWRKLSRKLK